MKNAKCRLINFFYFFSNFVHETPTIDRMGTEMLIRMTMIVQVLIVVPHHRLIIQEKRIVKQFKIIFPVNIVIDQFHSNLMRHIR